MDSEMKSNFNWDDVPGSEMPDSTGCGLSVATQLLAGALGVLVLVSIALVVVSVLMSSSSEQAMTAAQDMAENTNFNNPGVCLPCGVSYVLPLALSLLQMTDVEYLMALGVLVAFFILGVFLIAIVITALSRKGGR